MFTHAVVGFGGSETIEEQWKAAGTDKTDLLSVKLAADFTAESLSYILTWFVTKMRSQKSGNVHLLKGSEASNAKATFRTVYPGNLST